MARIELERVGKVYANGVAAVREFSLTLEDGELLALVGPSGCGKTTLLRLIAGLETPSGGTIRIGQRDVRGLPPKDRDLAMVFQNAALYPHLSVQDNIGFSLRMRGVPRKAIRQRVQEAGEMLGIGHLLSRRPRELSGGEGQRVALGRAVVRRPACFLFDEPLSSLDAPRRAELRAEIKRLHARLGATMLYVTHDQEEAMSIGQRIAVMNDGRLEQVGSPLEVYQRPRSAWVARFVGSPPMNLIEGTLLADDGRLWFDDGMHRLLVPSSAHAAISKYAGKPIVLGVRPEALREEPWGQATGGAISVHVESLEPLGDRCDVYGVTARGVRLVARLDCRTTAAPGQPLTLHPDPDRLHFFAAGERIG